MRKTPLALLLATAVLAGCGQSDPLGLDKPRRGVATQAGGQLAPVDEEGKPLGQPPPPPPPPEGSPAGQGQTAPAPPPPEVVREKAKPGVTGKGQDLGTGPIVTPVSIYFSIRERLLFQVQIPKAMKIYKGIHGHAPKTPDEFMEQIVRKNGLQLPELPEGHRYVYDPETEQLMVERPRH